MTRNGATRQRGFGVAAIAFIIIFASLALSAALLWRWLGTDDQAGEASGVEAPGAEQLAAPSPSPVPVKPASAEAIRERQQPAESLPQVDGENRAASDAASVQGSSESVSRALDSRAGGPAARSPYPQMPAPESPQQGAPLPRAAAASSVRVATPEATPVKVGADSDRQPADSAGPKVLQVWFERVAVGGGETNVIWVEARDDGSGVASVMGACESPSKSTLIWFSTIPNAQSGIWEGQVRIPKDAECGEWAVQQLTAKDKVGNTTQLVSKTPPLTGASFHVAFRPDCDFTPPTLDAFDLSPRIVSNQTATEVVVTATVNDQGTGVVSMAGWFDGPVSTGGQVPRIDFRCSPVDPKVPQAPWTCKVVVPPLAPKGTWKVGVIRVRDKALNLREYTAAAPVVAGQVFEVQ